MAWDFWIDRGGTFTDIVARDPGGRLHCAKFLSENPDRYRDAALHGIRGFLGLGPEAPIPAARIASVRMGTTVATNALLEGRGHPVVLVTTRGLGERLRIACQNRPRLLDRHIALPDMLHSRTIEARERVRADGTVEIPLDEAHLSDELATARAAGFDACAIVFVHGCRHRAHETRAAELARAAGFAQVSVGHEVSPLAKMVSRGVTTMVDACLTPILRGCVDPVAAAFDGDMTGKLVFMQSSGVFADAGQFRGKDAVLSGAAGGVVGAAHVSRIAGQGAIVGVDMGGASTHVCHFAGAFERALSTEIAGVRITAPTMRIHTVAAGGGSLLSFDGSRMRVGPGSAGADPGPAACGRGGPLAVTDANVLTGRLRPEFFPAIFGPEGDRPLDAEATHAGFTRLAAEIGKPAEEIAEGFLRIAVESVASAIRTIGVRRGHDVTGHCLTVFGGAGAQHACAIADTLGMRVCLVHPMASLLSAYGMGLADIRASRVETFEADLDPASRLAAAARLDGLGVVVLGEVEAQGVPERSVRLTQRVHLKMRGTDVALAVPFGTLAEMRAAFGGAHRARFGLEPGAGLVIHAVEVEAVGASTDPGEPAAPEVERGEDTCAVALTAPVWLHGGRIETRFVRRGALVPGDRVSGPAVIVEDHTSILVEPGWRARITAHDHVLLERIAARTERAIGAEADPALFEVFDNLHMSIAGQTGAELEKTAASATVKEGLDFSRIVFGAEGSLIASAPQVPIACRPGGAGMALSGGAGRVPYPPGLRRRGAVPGGDGTQGADRRGVGPGDVWIMETPGDGYGKPR